MNQLFFGDNLDVLRESITSESVDLVYLDPPFNSKRDYNLLFKSPEGGQSHAQITAFEDSWHWGEQAEREFDQILHSGQTGVADLISAFRSFLGENDLSIDSPPRINVGHRPPLSPPDLALGGTRQAGSRAGIG